jgi:hypothetical protein
MAADNVVACAGSGGATFRCFSDGTNEWPAGVCCYVVSGSAGSWTLQQVDVNHGLPVTPTQGTLTDRSGTITTGGTAQQLAAANTSRKYLLIQNTGNTDLWFNFTTTAVQGQPSFKLSPGASFVMEHSYVSTEAVSILGATTGQTSPRRRDEMGLAQCLADVQTSTAGVGNGADTTDDTLFTWPLPMWALRSNYHGLRAVASGHFASNGNNKRVKLWFAGTVVVDSGVLTSNNADWLAEMVIHRIDSTHVSCVGRFTVSGSADTVTVTANLSVSDLTANASTVKITGSSPTTGAANDVLGYLMKTYVDQ